MEKATAFIVVIVGWVFSLCLHEFSHAVVAYYGGDTSVKDKGYLTFNPLKYTHPVYSIVLPVVFLLLGGIGLPGGAVYIETWRLRSKRWESAVSLAGPASNLVLAILLAIILNFLPVSSSGIWPGLAFLALLQVTAVVLNLIPVPPFDGYRTLAPFLNRQLRFNIDQYSNIILMIVFVVLWYVPFVNDFFWLAVGWISLRLQIPLSLAMLGLSQFQFWR
ncbi:MAG: site-2 protease family protein [Anaerolineales bacterium]|jgi:Zn-dependent protease|nr:site-2 protease family protein [Candidatus Atribacteria bacterium]MDP2995684.1 site-2 protease family protein [Anaerolineales bacterium]